MILIQKYHQNLLDWYAVHRRALPWRSMPNEVPNPYHVWVSEIMLQQTTVLTVRDYYLTFLKRWPTVETLAKASIDEIFHAWQGLGYYRRARNMHRCAQIIVDIYGGNFPSEEKDLLKLPGIGPYTAAALSSIGFNKPATVVDGNIERVMARLFQLETPLPKVKKEIREKASYLKSLENPGDYAQALMDLGSTICTPRKPNCVLCPIQVFCKSAKKNPEYFPRPAPKIAKPIRYATFLWVENNKGEVLIEKRPEKGLLAGLMGFPTSPWEENPVERLWPFKKSKRLEKSIRHTFTHFQLIGTVIMAQSENREGIWVHPKDLHNYALPTLMKKVEKLVQEEGR
jgi:A/G-specific adenine glycosylase